MVELCVPVTDIFRRNQHELLPLVGAVSFKAVTGETFYGKEHMLECSLNIADRLLPARMEETGLLGALRSGRFTSFACDLGPAWVTFPTEQSRNGYPRYLPGSGPMTEEEYLDAAEQNVRFLRSQFMGKIKVENLNYFPTGAYDVVCEPRFIARALQRLQIELLLDIGHLTISAYNLGIPVEEYLACLPVALVSEVQLSGSNTVDGILEDTHELPSEADMETLRSILARSDVDYVTLEYYKNDRKLVAGYRWLAEWIQATSSRVR